MTTTSSWKSLLASSIVDTTANKATLELDFESVFHEGKEVERHQNNDDDFAPQKLPLSRAKIAEPTQRKGATWATSKKYFDLKFSVLALLRMGKQLAISENMKSFMLINHCREQNELFEWQAASQISSTSFSSLFCFPSRYKSQYESHPRSTPVPKYDNKKLKIWSRILTRSVLCIKNFR
jgi:hypothetical protein